MLSNFAFLEHDFPQLEKLGGLAESYLYSDPNACLIKLGMLSEGMVNLMFQLDRMDFPEDASLSNKIRILKNEGMLPRDVSDMLYQLRIKRNEAAHEGFGMTESAAILLEMAWRLAVWFMQTYGDYSFESDEFVSPSDASLNAGYERLAAENEELSRRLEAVSANVATLTPPERRRRGETAASRINLSEAETRVLIDEQLRQVGWETDTVNLRYSKGTRPQKGRNLAIAEYPTDSTICKYGSADYALYAGLTLVGVIEAKSAHRDISAIIDNQCRDYTMGLRVAEESATYGEGAYKSPFVFATNGRPYLAQIETKSGIWFKDMRKSTNIPKALQGWLSPQGLLDLLAEDISAANSVLQNMPYDLLRDPDGLNLRPYQLEAIEKAENSVVAEKKTALLAMATGTGKTRTVLGMIYRFLKAPDVSAGFFSLLTAPRLANRLRMSLRKSNWKT